MISIFFSTPNDSKEHYEYLKETCTLPNVEIIQFVNKKQYSLAQAYNIALKDSKHDILVCLHDDVLLDKGWDQKIYNQFQNSDYGIIGVAGTTELDETGMWWRKPQFMVGEVYHQNKEGKWYQSKYNNMVPGEIHETVLVDGLFIGIHKQRIKSEFDEAFKGFHFYDIPFCINNHTKGVKIGVINDFKVRHQSIGMVNQEWHDERLNFTTLYKDMLPVKIHSKPFISQRIPKLKQEPSLVIIIPSKDNYELLKGCVESLQKTNYSNYKIIIADTGSNEENMASIETLVSDRISLVKYDYYHFAKINNDVVKNYTDKNVELLLFCNDDVIMQNDAISLMVETYLKNKKTVGTLGCRLHYENGSIQHGGIICYQNKENRMGFTHKGIRTSYGASFKTEENILGNTGAFLMIRKPLFIGIGGFDENPKECFEDVILNMDCILRNYKNIYIGEAVCQHLESFTRKNDKDKVSREIEDASKFVVPKISKNIKKLQKFITRI